MMGWKENRIHRIQAGGLERRISRELNMPEFYNSRLRVWERGSGQQKADIWGKPLLSFEKPELLCGRFSQASCSLS